MEAKVNPVNRRSFAILAAGALRASAQSNSSEPIRVLASPFIGSAPLYLAEESGYFRSEGLKVEILHSEGSRAAIPLLAGGKADVAFSTLSPPVFNAISRGARVRLVATRSKFTGACPDQRRLYGSRNAFPNGFRDLRQMKGKRIALNDRLSIVSYGFSKVLDMTGMKRDDFTLVRLEDEEAAAMLVAGRVDVCFGAATTIRLTAAADRVVPGPSFNVFLPNFAHGHVLYGKRLLDAPPAHGTKFLRAILRASRDYVSGKDPAWIQQFAREQGYDQQRLKERCRQEIDVDGSMNQQHIQEYIDWGVREKLIPTPLNAADCLEYVFLRNLKNG